MRTQVVAINFRPSMTRTSILIALSLITWATPHLVRATDAEECKVLEIQGGKVAKLAAGDSGVNPLPLKVGDFVQKGEAIITGPDTRVKVRYGDGSSVLLDQNTKAILLSLKRIIQVPSTHLEFGKLRAQVVPEKNKDPKKVYKFSVRSRAATLGVRGTDFIVNSGSQGETSEVTTLDGTVDVASDEEDLSTGKVVPVAKGQSLQITAGQPPSKQSLTEIDLKKWIQEEKRQNPMLGAEIYEVPPPPPITEEHSQEGKSRRSPNEGNELPKWTRAQWTSLRLLSFQASYLSLDYHYDYHSESQFASGTMQIDAGEIAWTPYLPLGKSLGISGHLGAVHFLDNQRLRDQFADSVVFQQGEGGGGSGPLDILGKWGNRLGVGIHLQVPFTRFELSFKKTWMQFVKEQSKRSPANYFSLGYRIQDGDERGGLEKISITVGGYEPGGLEQSAQMYETLKEAFVGLSFTL